LARQRLHYRSELKPLARALRSQQTDAENILWSKLRRKQVMGVQFYRQRPIGSYIVDFFAPKASLVIEVDGGQHLEDVQLANDLKRDESLARQGLRVLRFDNLEVLRETDAVLERIFSVVRATLVKSPPTPP